MNNYAGSGRRRPDTAHSSMRGRSLAGMPQNPNLIKNIHDNLMLYKSLHHDIRAIDQTQHVNINKIPTIFGRVSHSPVKNSLKVGRSKTQIGVLNATSSSLNKNKKLM